MYIYNVHYSQLAGVHVYAQCTVLDQSRPVINIFIHFYGWEDLISKAGNLRLLPTFGKKIICAQV